MTASTQLLGLLTVSQPFIWRIEILPKPLQSTHCSHLHPLAVEPEWSRDRPSGLPRAADQPELVNRGIGFAPDSLLEQRRFELSVPPGHNLSAVGKMLRHPRSRKSGSQEVRSWRKPDANLRPLRGPKMNPAQPETRKYRS